MSDLFAFWLNWSSATGEEKGTALGNRGKKHKKEYENNQCFLCSF